MGLLYPLLSREYNDLGKMLNGIILGFLGSGFLVLNEIWFNRSFVRKMKFITHLFYKSLLYLTFFTFIIIFVVSSHRAIVKNTNLISFIGSEDFNYLLLEGDIGIIIIYALAATISFILVYQISKKMGQGVLWNFIIGKYHRAREEERIFMFMDINNSTELAENLGDIEYNKLLNDFFFDITNSILINYGEIYRYVGDQVVVSWELRRGLPQAKFLRAFFHAKRAIHLKREKYLQRYNLIPSFKAGFNYGKIIVGEIGEVKSQICFFGDVMYETTVLEKSCKKFNTDNLISDTLLNMVELPQIFSTKQEGEIKIPGFAAINAYSISER